MWRRDPIRRHPRRRAASLALPIALVAVLALAPSSAGIAAAANPNCTPAQGQALIDAGRYDHAVREFSCVIAAAPTSAEGYRGRAEALLLLGRYSDAYHDYNTGITALVVPADPSAVSAIHDGYVARLRANPGSIPALTGASFARWVFFDYPQALRLLDSLLAVRPDDAYGTLFRGSTRVLKGLSTSLGVADLERAIALAPTSPDVRYVIADAYTYGLADPQRAFDEASRALAWGLDTARVHAILAASYTAFGDDAAAAAEIDRYFSLVTTEVIEMEALEPGSSVKVAVVPGQTVDIPLELVAGETISVSVGSKDYWDTIAVLYAPDGTPVAGSDDTLAYHAAFDLPASTSGTHLLRVGFFEAVITGDLAISRD